MEEGKIMVLEKRVLREVFVYNKEGFRGDRRKLHHVELHDSYYSTNIIRVIKSKMTRWAGHVAV
jgi:hypothetical protein